MRRISVCSTRAIKEKESSQDKADTVTPWTKKSSSPQWLHRHQEAEEALCSESARPRRRDRQLRGSRATKRRMTRRGPRLSMRTYTPLWANQTHSAMSMLVSLRMLNLRDLKIFLDRTSLHLLHTLGLTSMFQPRSVITVQSQSTTMKKTSTILCSATRMSTRTMFLVLDLLSQCQPTEHNKDLKYTRQSHCIRNFNLVASPSRSHDRATKTTMASWALNKMKNW